MKKILTVLLTLVCIVSLAACGGKTDKSDNSDSSNTTDTQTTESAKQAPELEQKTASEPFNPMPGSVTIGDVTLSAELIKLDKPMQVSSQSRPYMAVFGDTIYIGDGDKVVKKYTLSGNALTLVKEMNIPNSNGIAVDGKGQLYADGGVFAAKIYDGEGNQVGEAADKGNISISQTEDFALTYYPGRDAVTKISGGTASQWVISGLRSNDPSQIKGPFNTISAIEVVDSHVLVAGSIEKEQKLVVFDTAGNEVARSSEKLFGNGISAMTETANGYITASVSTIHLIKKDGTFIGKSNSTKPLFGVEEIVWLKKFVPSLMVRCLRFAEQKEPTKPPRRCYTGLRDFNTGVRQHEKICSNFGSACSVFKHYCFCRA